MSDNIKIMGGTKLPSRQPPNGESRSATGKLDIALAKKLVPFFVGRVLRKYPGRVALTAVLNIVSVGAQLGFLAMLPTALQALSGRADTAVSSGIALPFDLPNPGLMTAVAISFSMLVIAALSEYFQQKTIARINSLTFRGLMRSVLRQLIKRNAQAAQDRRTGAKSLVNLFAKSCRYGSLVGYRSLRVVRPLFAVPALLAFCLWHSPVLTGVVFCVYLIAMPFHLALVKRGIASMRHLLRSSAHHVGTKKTLMANLFEFPSWEHFDVDEMERVGIDEGSKDYLEAYYERRMLAARSLLVNVLSIALALFAVIVIVASNIIPVSLSIAELLVLVLALRFLVTSVGQIITDVTMVSSYTPLCEDLFHFLQSEDDNSGDRFLLGREGLVGNDESGQLIPHVLAFTIDPLPAPMLGKFAASLVNDPHWRQAPIVRGNYAPYFSSLQQNLFDQIAEGVERPFSMESDAATALRNALEHERSSGWSEALWTGLPASVKVSCTLNAALMSGAKHIILVGPVQSSLGVSTWQRAEALLRERGVNAIQILDAAPRNLAVPSGVEGIILDGMAVESLGPIANYRATAPDIIQMIARLRKSRLDETEKLGTLDETMEEL